MSWACAPTIIGAGATAIQCVPHLGQHARHLYVLTPSSVDVRGTSPVTQNG
jgi:hypothetical protein